MCSAGVSGGLHQSGICDEQSGQRQEGLRGPHTLDHITTSELTVCCKYSIIIEIVSRVHFMSEHINLCAHVRYIVLRVLLTKCSHLLYSCLGVRACNNYDLKVIWFCLFCPKCTVFRNLILCGFKASHRNHVLHNCQRICVAYNRTITYEI